MTTARIKTCVIKLLIIMLMHLDLSPTVLRPKKMCDKVLSFYNAIPDRFKTQEVCDKAVDTFSFVFDFVPD